MNEEFTTQVDEACEDTNNRDQCDLQKFTKDFARHIEANERCDICGKIASVWEKLTTTKKSKSKKELNMLMKVWLQPPFKTPLMKHIKNKHLKKTAKNR